MADACARLFFALEALSQVHYLYEFSLQFFIDTLITLLTQDADLKLLARTDLEGRRKLIYDLIFLRVYQRVQSSLLQRDRLLFALRIAQIKLPKGTTSIEQIFKSLIRASPSAALLLEGGAAGANSCAALGL